MCRLPNFGIGSRHGRHWALKFRDRLPLLPTDAREEIRGPDRAPIDYAQRMLSTAS